MLPVHKFVKVTVHQTAKHSPIINPIFLPN